MSNFRNSRGSNHWDLLPSPDSGAGVLLGGMGWEEKLFGQVVNVIGKDFKEFSAFHPVIFKNVKMVGDDESALFADFQHFA